MVGYTNELEAALKRAGPLAQRFEAAGYRFFLVGGVVRDNFLGRRDVGQDLDATTDARPDAIKGLVKGLADQVWLQGERFGTVGCVIAGQSYEITTHRAESYQRDSRKPTVVFGYDVIEDLARRDFTVNAMAIDMADHSLVDPFGGRADLNARLLRTPVEPGLSLSEDPLRMLRAARFCSSCQLSAAPELVTAIAAERGRLEIVSLERIRDELQRLLLLDDPGPGLRLIDATGIGPLVPGVGSAVDSAVDRRVGPGDRWGSVADRVRAVPRLPAPRWAALLSGSRIEKVDLSALKFSRELARSVKWLLSEGLRLSAEDLAALSDRQFRGLARGCPSGRVVEDLLTFVAGLRSGDGLSDDDVVEARRRLVELRRRESDLDDPAPLLSGLEVAGILGIEPGPELGRAMNFLMELRVAQGPLDVDAAVRRLQDWWTGSQGS